MCNDDYSSAGYGDRTLGEKRRGPRPGGLGMNRIVISILDERLWIIIIRLIDLLILVAPSISLQKRT